MKKVGKKSEKRRWKEGRSYCRSPQKYEGHSHIARNLGSGTRERRSKECRSLTHCPKVSHISTTSNYSGIQTLSGIWDIQFSIKNNLEEHVVAVHEDEKPSENWTTRMLPKSFTHEHNIKLFWYTNFKQYLRTSIFNLLFEFLKAKLKMKLKNWTTRMLPKSFTHELFKYI